MMGMPDTENVVVDVTAASVLSCNTGLRLFELQIVNYLLFFQIATYFTGTIAVQGLIIL